MTPRHWPATSVETGTCSQRVRLSNRKPRHTQKSEGGITPGGGISVVRLVFRFSQSICERCLLLPLRTVFASAVCCFRSAEYCKPLLKVASLQRVFARNEMGGARGTYRRIGEVPKPERQMPFGRCGRRWEYNIKIDLTEIGPEYVDCSG
jgi:hypothetical protein